MTVLERKATGVEHLQVNNCPCCGSEVSVGDCGYSSANPGWAKCIGSCGREWDMGYVDDEWECGLKWNSRQKDIQHGLKVLAWLKLTGNLQLQGISFAKLWKTKLL